MIHRNSPQQYSRAEQLTTGPETLMLINLFIHALAITATRSMALGVFRLDTQKIQHTVIFVDISILLIYEYISFPDLIIDWKKSSIKSYWRSTFFTLTNCLVATYLVNDKLDFEILGVVILLIYHEMNFLNWVMTRFATVWTLKVEAASITRQKRYLWSTCLHIFLRNTNSTYITSDHYWRSSIINRDRWHDKMMCHVWRVSK